MAKSIDYVAVFTREIKAIQDESEKKAQKKGRFNQPSLL
jgi:hypothetical protein